MPLNIGLSKENEEMNKPRILANRYQVIRKLGSGKFGTAFLVKDLKPPKGSEELKVIKEIPVGILEPDESIDAMHEARLLSKLTHHSIVKFYDSFLEGMFFCIVTEYCDGGDLEKYISNAKKDGKHLDESLVIQWTIQLLLGVHYLHSRKVLHRDLKSSNIFLKNNMIKIGDFGISRILMGTMDKASTFVGTPYYMSPEVLQHEGYNSKSDVWSIGCVLYEMCAMKHAFEGQGLMGVMYKIVEGLCPTLPAGYSANLQRVLENILIKDPNKRSGAADILKDEYVARHLKIFKNNLSLLQQNIADLTLASMTQGRNEANKINKLLQKSTHLDQSADGLTPAQRMRLRKEEAADKHASQIKEAISNTYSSNKEAVKARKVKTLTGSDVISLIESRPKFQVAVERNYNEEDRQMRHSNDKSASAVAPGATYVLKPSHNVGLGAEDNYVSIQPSVQLSDSRLSSKTDHAVPTIQSVAFRSHLYDEKPIQSGRPNIYDLSHNELQLQAGVKQPLKIDPTLDVISGENSNSQSDYEEDFDDEVEEEPEARNDDEDSGDDTIGNYINQMENVLNSSYTDATGTFSDQTLLFSPNMLAMKVLNLRRECENKLGADVFRKVYDYLHRKRLVEKNAAGESDIMRGLREITEKIADCFLVDQLIFLEDSPAALTTK